MKHIVILFTLLSVLKILNAQNNAKNLTDSVFAELQDYIIRNNISNEQLSIKVFPVYEVDTLCLENNFECLHISQRAIVIFEGKNDFGEVIIRTSASRFVIYTSSNSCRIESIPYLKLISKYDISKSKVYFLTIGKYPIDGIYIQDEESTLFIDKQNNVFSSVQEFLKKTYFIRESTKRSKPILKFKNVSEAREFLKSDYYEYSKCFPSDTFAIINMFVNNINTLNVFSKKEKDIITDSIYYKIRKNDCSSDQFGVELMSQDISDVLHRILGINNYYAMLGCIDANRTARSTALEVVTNDIKLKHNTGRLSANRIYKKEVFGYEDKEWETKRLNLIKEMKFKDEKGNK